MVVETLTKEMETSTNIHTYTKVTNTTVNQSLEEDKLQQIAALERMWVRIRTARLRIRKQRDTIRNFYKKVFSFKNNYSFQWLPSEHLAYYEKKIRHLEKHLKVENMIPKLYSSLESFSSTFEEMMQFNKVDDRTPQPSSYVDRKNILEPISRDLNSTMEEVETTVHTFGLSTNASNANETAKVKHWDDKLSQTHIMVQDWGVITLYYRFIKDWEKISQLLFESYCNAASVAHDCHQSLKMAAQIVR